MIRLSLLVAVSAVLPMCDPPARPDQPPFASAVSVLDAATRTAMTGVTWEPGCPVGLDDLRAIELTFWGMDDTAHTGTLVVHADAVDAMVATFAELYRWRFPLTSMIPIEAFDGSDDASVAADNTSAFNCRPVEGTTRWSMHAYGRAIDVNPCRNPYVRSDGSVKMAPCRPFADRRRTDPGMIQPGDIVVKAFAGQGWAWGGDFRASKDYQHFSSTGR